MEDSIQVSYPRYDIQYVVLFGNPGNSRIVSGGYLFELEVFPSVLSVASSWEGAAFCFSLSVMLQPFHKVQVQQNVPDGISAYFCFYEIVHRQIYLQDTVRCLSLIHI